MTLDEALQLIADGGFPKDWDKCCGLCTNIAKHARGYIPHVERIVGRIAEDWEHFSGDRRFPVPSDIHFEVLEGFSSQADKRYMTCDSFYEGEYGTKRRALAGYLVGKLSKENMAQNAVRSLTI